MQCRDGGPKTDPWGTPERGISKRLPELLILTN